MYGRGAWANEHADSNTGETDRVLSESNASKSREQTAYEYADLHWPRRQDWKIPEVDS